MNSTMLAARVRFMAQQLTGEAQRQHGDKRTDLQRAARQLNYAWRGAYSTDPQQRAVTEALLDGAIDYLVDVITARTERELTEGLPQ